MLGWLIAVIVVGLLLYLIYVAVQRNRKGNL